MTPASNAAAPGRLECNGTKWQLFPFPPSPGPQGKGKSVPDRSKRRDQKADSQAQRCRGRDKAVGRNDRKPWRGPGLAEPAVD